MVKTTVGFYSLMNRKYPDTAFTKVRNHNAFLLSASLDEVDAADYNQETYTGPFKHYKYICYLPDPQPLTKADNATLIAGGYCPRSNQAALAFLSREKYEYDMGAYYSHHSPSEIYRNYTQDQSQIHIPTSLLDQRRGWKAIEVKLKGGDKQLFCNLPTMYINEDTIVILTQAWTHRKHISDVERRNNNQIASIHKLLTTCYILETYAPEDTDTLRIFKIQLDKLWRQREPNLPLDSKAAYSVPLTEQGEYDITRADEVKWKTLYQTLLESCGAPTIPSGSSPQDVLYEAISEFERTVSLWPSLKSEA